MAFLDSFELVRENKDIPFITVRNTTITFSKSAIEYLNYAAYIHMYIDKKNRKVAFQACKQDDSAIRFFTEPEKGKQILVRIAGKQKIQLLMEQMGVEDCGKGIRCYGEYINEEAILVIDLKIGKGNNND